MVDRGFRLPEPEPIFTPELEQEEPSEELEEQDFEPVEEVVVEEAPEPKIVIGGGDDMSDMFEAPKAGDADIDASDLVALDVEEDVIGGDLSDLTEVDFARDIMGYENEEPELAPQPRKVRRFLRRTNKRYPPMTGMQGLR